MEPGFPEALRLQLCDAGEFLGKGVHNMKNGLLAIL
jgi:hypothetical protein